LWNVQLIALVPIGFRLLPKENTGQSGGSGPERDSARCTKPAISSAIFGPKGTREAILSELGLANDQNPVIKIQVLATETRYLPDAQPEPVQQGKDHPVDLSAGLCSRIARQLGGCFEKPSRLVYSEEK
jgi:hypothetical protein